MDFISPLCKKSGRDAAARPRSRAQRRLHHNGCFVTALRKGTQPGQAQPSCFAQQFGRRWRPWGAGFCTCPAGVVLGSLSRRGWPQGGWVLHAPSADGLGETPVSRCGDPWLRFRKLIGGSVGVSGTGCREIQCPAGAQGDVEKLFKGSGLMSV